MNTENLEYQIKELFLSGDINRYAFELLMAVIQHDLKQQNKPLKSTHEIFKEVLVELGFDDYLPSDMTNSDYWLCTTTAMERYAEQIENSIS